jgi:hypothetical protein
MSAPVPGTLFDELPAGADRQLAATVEPFCFEPAPPQLPAPPGFPSPPAACAYHGLLGAIVQKLSPHTESDPVAILAQLIVGAGSLIGREAHYRVEVTRHHPHEFLLLVGETSRGRKGQALDHATRLLAAADPELNKRIATGLSSGEGLTWKLRDAHAQDPGAVDKRVLIIETEFASVLKAAARENSTLSPTLRNAWDGRPLQLLTRTAPALATDAHVSIIGHITAAELRRHITTNELANGLLNRLILLAVRRVRLLPEGGDPEPLAGTGLPDFFAATIRHARQAGQLKLDQHARELWHKLYPALSEPGEGLAGQLTARAEAHTIRLALLYALLDGERAIGQQHLEAALALWDYAQRSARWALGQSTGDPLAEQIHAALERSPAGLTRTQLRDLLQRNQPAEHVEQALHALTTAGRATRQHVHTNGRPAELWTAAPAPEHTP